MPHTPESRVKNWGDKRHVLTDEDRKRAGKRTQEKLKEKKTYQEMAEALNERMPTAKNLEELRKRGFKDNEVNNQFLFVYSVFMRATKGDVKAMKLWLELTSPIPQERENLELEKLKAEIEQMKSETATATDIEDLTPLAALLSDSPPPSDSDTE